MSRKHRSVVSVQTLPSSMVEKIISLCKVHGKNFRVHTLLVAIIASILKKAQFIHTAGTRLCQNCFMDSLIYSILVVITPL